MFTNRIPTGKNGKSFADIVRGVTEKTQAKQAAAEEAVIKTASAEKAVKEAKELTPAQEKLPEALKDAIRGKSDGGSDGGSDDAKSDGDEDKEASAKVKGKVKVAEGEPDEGESSGQLDVEPLHQEGESTPVVGKKDTEAKAKGKVKVAEGEPECGESSGQLDVEPLEQEGDSRDPGKCLANDPKNASSARFVKVADLDDETRNWFNDYWKDIYPAEYVDALSASK